VRKGFEEAAFEYMLLCDDDNWLQPGYVQLAYELMNENSKIAVLGGIGEAVCEGEIPAWFEKEKGHYATGPQAPGSGDVSRTQKYVFGAGAIIRNSAYQHIKSKGFKSILTDRKGKELSSGGDSELCYIFILAGYQVWYNEQLRFKHFISKDKLTWHYLHRLYCAFAHTAFYLRSYTYYLIPGKSS
jgi:hypothetical protein